MANEKVVIIETGSVKIRVALLNTPTAEKIFAASPMESSARTWGEEVYFSLPVQVEREEGAKEVVQAGEIAFWVEGSCVAIGFGPTPISQKGEIRLAAKTNIWAKALDDVTLLRSVIDGDRVSLTKEKG